MKRIIVFIILPLFINSCFDKRSKQTAISNHLEDSAIISPFNSALDKNITEFIAFNNEKGREKFNVYTIRPYYDEYNKNCILYIGSDFYYDKDITHYYYINNGRLFVIEGADTICAKRFIDFSKMQKFNDSIPKFKDISKMGVNERYDGYTMMLKIINHDSLEVMSISY